MPSEENEPASKDQKPDEFFAGQENRTELERSVGKEFTDEECNKIYEYYAQGYSARQIIAHFNKDRGHQDLKLNPGSLESVLDKEDAAEAVARHRYNYIKKIKMEPMADRLLRLDSLEQIRRRISLMLSRMKPETNPKCRPFYMNGAKLLIDILDLARREVMGTQLYAGLGHPVEGLDEIADGDLIEQRDALLKRVENLKRRSQAVDTPAGGDGAEGED